MKTVAYLKASENELDIQEQKQAILDFAVREKITLSRFIEIFASSQIRIRRYAYCQRYSSNRTVSL